MMLQTGGNERKRENDAVDSDDDSITTEGVYNVDETTVPSPDADSNFYKPVENPRGDASTRRSDKEVDSSESESTRQTTSSVSTSPTALSTASNTWYKRLMHDHSIQLNKLVTHGAPWLTATPDGLMTGTQLGQFIKQRGKTDNKTPFILYSCYGASGGCVSSQGQALANTLGVTVQTRKGVASQWLTA